MSPNPIRSRIYVSTYSISFLRFLFSKLHLYLFRLPDRQWKLLFESDDSDLDDKLGFDLDPSVQFFGIDWERVFGRCFSLSMHVNLLESALVLQESELEAEYQNKLNKQTNFPNSETHPKSVQSAPELDLVRINKMLKELAAIEADVLSHSEAVLRGRLSKSQRQLIFDEQNKYASLTTQTSISKSKSFRDAGSGSKNRPRQAIKYRKNKTTNLDKLTSSMSAHTIRCGEENNLSTDDGNENNSDEQTNSLLENCKKSTLVSMSASSKRKSTSGSMNGSGSNNGSNTTSGFMQNVTSMFKNIRWLSIRSPTKNTVVQKACPPPAPINSNNPRFVSTFRRLPNGRNIFKTVRLRRQNTSQQLLPPENSVVLPGLI